MRGLPPSRRRHLRTWQPGDQPWLLEDASLTDRKTLLDLASNDYFGLSRHPAVLQAATNTLEREGVGSGGSRLVTGTRPSHAALENAIAEWVGRERVFLFPSGFQANIAAIDALADRHSIVLADRLIHHSLLVGVRASGAKLLRFAHNDLEDLEQRLKRLPEGRPSLVISESLFSMEGTSPDLQAMAALCAAWGARLLVDEAHALGVMGEQGRGLCFGIDEPIHLISGTFGKAFGSGGAFLATDRHLGDQLLQTSGAFRYTTALAPPLVGAALKALDLIRSHPEWGQELQQAAGQWRDALKRQGWPRPMGHGPILPLLIGSETDALSLQQVLEQSGLLTVAIRPPTVPEGSSRLRLVVRRDLPDDTLEALLTALASG